MWKFSNCRPEQGEPVEVITYDGKQCFGRFLADNNWEIKGYPHDLFNRDIVAWQPKKGTMIDYKELLAKYVRHVAGQTDYEYNLPIGPMLSDAYRAGSDFTDEEWIEVRKLAGMPPTDPPPAPTAATDPAVEEAEFKERLRAGTKRFMMHEKGRI